MSIYTSPSSQASSDQIHDFNYVLPRSCDAVAMASYPQRRLVIDAVEPGTFKSGHENALKAPGLAQLRTHPTNYAAELNATDTSFPGLSLEGLMHALPSAIVILDSYGRIQHSNPAASQMLGSLQPGQYWRDLIKDRFEPRLDDGHEVSLKNGMRVNLLTRSLAAGSGQLIVINDLTETRKLQTQLSRHQRLSSMGKMMSSLAHQIRTPLSAALLHADNLTRRHKNNEAVAESGSKIISRLRNIERQIRDMLIFAKGETTATSTLAASELVEHMRDSARDLAAYYSASLEWSDSSEGATLNCNLDALIGAFLNLLENAFQASEKGPQVTISVSVEGADSAYQDYMLSIEVIDQGAGIDESVLQSLEEAFSTTKANGNGLGLAIVRLVCKSHSGKFRLKGNASGEGVTAKMLLPVSFSGAAS